MTVTMLTPVDLAAPTRTGPRVYRKQVLARRGISYPLPGGGRRHVEFDEEYLTDLAEAFRAGAYDLVPFQLATPANEHNEDPRNYGGKVLGAEVTPEGLDLILELTEDASELVERTGGKLGVSARIKEQLEHVDGRRFKRAIRHVLGTLDPRMTGMSAWQPVDLAHNDTDAVIDLTALTYTEDRHMPKLIDLSALSDDDGARLLALAAAGGIDLTSATSDDTPADEPAPDASSPAPSDDEPTDEPADDNQPAADVAPDDSDTIEPLTDAELDALLDQALEGVGAGGTDLSATDDGPDDNLDLAAGLASDAHDEAQASRVQAGTARFELALERYGAKGVPPAALDLARPILELGDRDTGELNLSSPVTGDAINVHGIVTGLLDTLAGTVDLSSELGRGHDDGDQSDAAAKTAAGWINYLGRN